MSASTSNTATLKLNGQIPLDQEIEQIIRQSKNITIKSGTEQAHYGPDPEGLKILPEASRERLEASGVDLSKGYPNRPDKSKVPVYLDEAFAIRNEDYPYIERGKNADPEKKALKMN
ncbi:unnamed protein product [Ambrosiozyma monospora]|uniref:Unnamed protein product n=1 Tax=Ambrosiozyma monospora TaxID=43982 RepID=A0ACB5T772_AMBMO|nr:unnamed protein product [Ambrosiozyma monospora]